MRCSSELSWVTKILGNLEIAFLVRIANFRRKKNVEKEATY